MALALTFAIIVVTASSLRAQSIEGVWRLVEVENLSGPNAGVTTDLQPAYTIYTPGGHYSLAWIVSDGPRPVPGENASDAELVAAWGPIGVQFGTYEADGSNITFHQLVNKDPNGMQPDNAMFVREYTITGDTLETRGGNTRFRSVRVE